LLNNPRLTLPEYQQGVLSGNRVVLGKAITLIESTVADDQKLAIRLIENILPRSGKSVRIAVTGVPGVGKSTFIETFGKLITATGKKVAVLTVDPTSQLNRGSILGDKTRMEDLSKNPLAFIRPSASGEHLGGVAGKTREAILLCEAAGHEVIIIETVGVGQSEIAVKSMVDFFLLLMLAGGGDELQGIKRGIMEMADALVITKADGDNVNRAMQAQSEYQHAIHLLPPKPSRWETPVLVCSSLMNTGIEDIWKMIVAYKSKTVSSGHFEHNRQLQNIDWFQESFQQLLKVDVAQHPAVQKMKETLAADIASQKVSPQQAAEQLLRSYHDAIQGNKS
jgi:LAO/AO transport system kinase